MKTYSFVGGRLTAGFVLTADSKLGQVLFVGETGRGRRYEKISLSRRNPVVVVDGKVMDAMLTPVTLRKGEPGEFTFMTIERPSVTDEAVLVRVSTEGTYTRDTCGCWTTLAGTPETLVKAYGAYGDAGRIGNWDDGIIAMRPGDAVKVVYSGGSKIAPDALVYRPEGLVAMSYQEYTTLREAEEAMAKLADAASGNLPVVADGAACYTFYQGKITDGIAVTTVPAGHAVVLGEDGRGREIVSVPVLGDAASDRLATVKVVETDRKMVRARYSWEKDEERVSYALISATRPTPGIAIVRVRTDWVYTRGTSGKWEVWKGAPLALASGYRAQGDAGRLGTSADSLVVLHEGDVLFVSPEGGRKVSMYAIFFASNKVVCRRWHDWKVEDGVRDPAFYITKGTAPWGKVPTEWIGREVEVRGWTGYYDARSGSYDRRTMDTRYKGVLVSASSAMVTLDHCIRYEDSYYEYPAEEQVDVRDSYNRKHVRGEYDPETHEPIELGREAVWVVLN